MNCRQQDTWKSMRTQTEGEIHTAEQLRFRKRLFFQSLEINVVHLSSFWRWKDSQSKGEKSTLATPHVHPSFMNPRSFFAHSSSFPTNTWFWLLCAALTSHLLWKDKRECFFLFAVIIQLMNGTVLLTKTGLLPFLVRAIAVKKVCNIAMQLICWDVWVKSKVLLASQVGIRTYFNWFRFFQNSKINNVWAYQYCKFKCCGS